MNKEDIFVKAVKVIGIAENTRDTTNVIFLEAHKKIEVTSCRNIIYVYKASGVCEETLKYHNSQTVDFLIALNQDVILSSSENYVIAHDLSEGQNYYKRFEIMNSCVKGILKLNSEDEDKFLVIGENGVLTVFSYEKSKMIMKYKHNEQLHPKFCSVEGREYSFLITSGNTKKLIGNFQQIQYSPRLKKLKNVNNYRHGHRKKITCLKTYIKVDGNQQRTLVVSCSRDKNNIVFWDLNTSKIHMMLPFYDYNIKDFFVMDSYLVFPVENGLYLQIYDFRRRIRSIQFQVHEDNCMISSMCVVDEPSHKFITCSGKNVVVSQIFRKQKLKHSSSSGNVNGLLGRNASSGSLVDQLLGGFNDSLEDVDEVDGEGALNGADEDGYFGHEEQTEEQTVVLHRLRAKIKEQERKIVFLENENRKLKSEVGEAQLSSLSYEERASLLNLEKRVIELKKREKHLERRSKELQEVIKDSRQLLDNSKVLGIFQYNDDELKMGNKIGDGAFGSVYECTWKFQKEIAVKEVPVRRNLPRASILKEFQDQVSLVHESVVRVYGYTLGRNRVRILMEKMDMDVMRYLEIRKPKIPEKIEIMRKMVECVHFLHTRNPKVLHRDIKTLNFLCDEIGEVVKIGDFGLLKTFQSSSTFIQSRVKGTMYYLAPELHSRTPQYSIFSDIYSLGVSFWEVLHEDFPYENEDPMVIFEEVKTKGLRPSLEAEGIPFEIKDLIRRMWQHQIKKRPTTYEILAWFDMSEENLKKKYFGKRFPVQKRVV